MSGETYQQTRNKTIKWCRDLLENQIYDRNQYTKCVNSFIDLTGGGHLPEPIEPPQTNNEFSYGLYDKDSDYTTKQIINTETGDVYLKTPNHLYLCANDSGEVRLSNGKDVNDPNQLKWKLMFQKDDRYYIQSFYQKFLTVKDNNKIMADIDATDIYSLWKIYKKENYLIIESVKIKDEKLTADNNNIKLTSGISQSQYWNLEGELSDNNSVIQKYDIQNDINKKNYLMEKLKNKLLDKYTKIVHIKLLIICARELEHTYCKIINIIKKNVNNINDKFQKDIKGLISESDSANNLVNIIRKQPLSTIINNYKLPNEFNKNDSTSIINLLTTNIFKVKNQFVINKDFPIKEDQISETCKNLYIGPTFPAMEKILKDKQAHAAKLSSIIEQEIENFNKLTEEVDSIDKEVVNYIINLEKRINKKDSDIKNNNKEINKLANKINNSQIKNNNLSIKENNIKKRDFITSHNEEKILNYKNREQFMFYLIISMSIFVLLMIMYSIYQL